MTMPLSTVMCCLVREPVPAKPRKAEEGEAGLLRAPLLKIVRKRSETDHPAIPRLRLAHSGIKEWKRQ
jgi:hypothetical protein